MYKKIIESISKFPSIFFIMSIIFLIIGLFLGDILSKASWKQLKSDNIRLEALSENNEIDNEELRLLRLHQIKAEELIALYEERHNELLTEKCSE